MDNTELYVFIAITLVGFATVAAWIESQLEKHDMPDYLRVLREERTYREHMARGPVVERRRAARQRAPRGLVKLLTKLRRGWVRGREPASVNQDAAVRNNHESGEV